MMLDGWETVPAVDGSRQGGTDKGVAALRAQLAGMADARDALVRRLGETAANQLLLERPAAILMNTPPHQVRPVPALSGQAKPARTSRWQLPGWLSRRG